jgi:hypothetical protein
MARVLAFVLLSGLFVACGTSSPTDPNNPPGGTTKIKQLGSVSLTETTAQGITTRGASGSFFEYSEAVDVPNNPQFLDEDTCVIVTVAEDEIPPTTPEGPTATSLDAGEALTLNDGDYSTLLKQVFEDSIVYLSDVSTPLLPFPTSVTLDIPGATNGFPAFENVTFPSIPAAFTLTEPSDPSTVTKATTFAWTGAASSDSVMQLVGSGPGSGDIEVVFSCVASDDGSFSFPAQAQSQLDALGFTTGSLSFANRSAIKQEVDGEAALYVSTGRSQAFFDPTP